MIRSGLWVIQDVEGMCCTGTIPFAVSLVLMDKTCNVLDVFYGTCDPASTPHDIKTANWWNDDSNRAQMLAEWPVTHESPKALGEAIATWAAACVNANPKQRLTVVSDNPGYDTAAVSRLLEKADHYPLRMLLANGSYGHEASVNDYIRGCVEAKGDDGKFINAHYLANTFVQSALENVLKKIPEALRAHTAKYWGPHHPVFDCLKLGFESRIYLAIE